MTPASADDLPGHAGGAPTGQLAKEDPEGNSYAGTGAASLRVGNAGSTNFAIVQAGISLDSMAGCCAKLTGAFKTGNFSPMASTLCGKD